MPGSTPICVQYFIKIESPMATKRRSWRFPNFSGSAEPSQPLAWILQIFILKVALLHLFKELNLHQLAAGEQLRQLPPDTQHFAYFLPLLLFFAHFDAILSLLRYADALLPS